MTYVIVWSTLASWEDSGVDTGLDICLLVLSEEDHTSTRTSEGLVGGSSDDITEFEWRVLFTGSDKTGDVSHITQEISTLTIGDLSKSSVIPISWVCGTTTDQKTWFEEVGVSLKLWVINVTGSRVDSVRERLEVD